MSTLTTLILIIAGIAMAYLLEEWSEKGGTMRTGGVSNRVLSGHMFSRFPTNFYTCYGKNSMGLMGTVFALSVFAFTWIAVNLPSLFELSTVYAVMGTMITAVGLIEYSTKNRMSALVGYLGENVSLGFLFLIGIAISLIFAPFVLFFDVWNFQIEPLAITGAPVLTFILVAVLIPFIEEGVWSGVVCPTFIERTGLVTGVLFVILSWVAFHYLAYQPFTASDFLFLGGFRLLTLIPIIKYKSLLPAVLSHNLINGIAVLASMGVFA